MKELVVLSGKGGTGKTSLVASFAALARGAVVVADCDVDAPDLHLVLEPVVEREEPFVGGKLAEIRAGACTSCGTCARVCRFDAVRGGPARGERTGGFRIDPIACEGCGVCAWFCPDGAIAFEPAVRGAWFRSSTRHGAMVHARLDPAAANSGKLVSLLREEARRIAAERRIPLVLIDGSPGIGCPVIASMAGASLVLAVTEATLAGEHDLARVLGLARGFGIRVAVCVNRADLDPELAGRIESRASEAGASVIPRIRFDRAVTEAQMAGRAVVELGGSGAAEDIRGGWEELCRILDRKPAMGHRLVSAP